MKREILFKAMRTDHKGFIEGYYLYSGYDKKHFITQNAQETGNRKQFVNLCHFFEIIPETLCQFTGLRDKDGTKIFEGDKLTGYPHGDAEVRWNTEHACFESTCEVDTFDDDGELKTQQEGCLLSNDLENCFNEWKVSGNIHDEEN